MKKAFLLVVILFISIISTACINNLAVQELNNKAKNYLDKGDFESAIGRLKSSIDLDSTIFETHYNLGIAYTQAEKYPEAVETFQNAIKLKPNFADTYYSLAVAQENYAKCIIDGSLKPSKEENKEVKNEEKSSAENLDGIKTDKNLSDDEKSQVAKLFNDAISSYSAYLDKAQEVNDKQEVQEKIEYLKTQLQKYSPDARP